MHTSFHVLGCSSPHDSIKYEKALLTQKGVKQAYVNFASGQVFVRYKPSKTDVSCFSSLAGKYGLTIREESRSSNLHRREWALFCAENANKPLVFENLYCAEGISAGEVVCYAASAMRQSGVQPGKALMSLAKQNGISLKKPTGWQLQLYQGVTAQVDGDRIMVGTPFLLSDSGIPLGSGVSFGPGQYLVYVAKNRQPIGCLVLKEVRQKNSRRT